MTTLVILVRKQAIKRGPKQGRAFTYLPLVNREQVRVGMLPQVADVVFGGSYRSMVLSLVASQKLRPEDYEAMKRAIAKLESAL